MDNKGFKVNSTVLETPYIETNTKKPSNFKGKQSQKVDINVLIARAQEIQSKVRSGRCYREVFRRCRIGLCSQR